MKYILFLCRHHDGPSQMAEALYNKYNRCSNTRAISAASQDALPIQEQYIELIKEIDVLQKKHQIASMTYDQLPHQIKKQVAEIVIVGRDIMCSTQSLQYSLVLDRKINDVKSRKEIQYLKNELHYQILNILKTKYLQSKKRCNQNIFIPL